MRSCDKLTVWPFAWLILLFPSCLVLSTHAPAHPPTRPALPINKICSNKIQDTMIRQYITDNFSVRFIYLFPVAVLRNTRLWIHISSPAWFEKHFHQTAVLQERLKRLIYCLIKILKLWSINFIAVQQTAGNMKFHPKQALSLIHKVSVCFGSEYPYHTGYIIHCRNPLSALDSWLRKVDAADKTLLINHSIRL